MAAELYDSELKLWIDDSTPDRANHDTLEAGCPPETPWTLIPCAASTGRSYCVSECAAAFDAD